VRVEVLTDRPEDRFATGRVLHREGAVAPLTIIAAAAIEDGPGWRLQFAEIRDRLAAESLRDVYLETVVDRATDLEPGAAYWHEVLGTKVRGLDGRLLGEVADVYRVATAEVYVVRGGPFGEFDLPVVKSIVADFAPERGEIIVDEAALDLAAPPVDEPVARPPRKRPRWSRHGKGGSPRPPGPDGPPERSDDLEPPQARHLEASPPEPEAEPFAPEGEPGQPPGDG
jgi:16S rRNA processing protein RimM